MKTKLIVLFFFSLHITCFAYTACDSLTISATTPSPVVSCENFPMIVTINNASGINFSNINFGIKFGQSGSITTFPSQHAIVAGYWVYDTVNISAHTTFIDTIIVHYDCHSVAIHVDDFASITVTDSLKISHGDSLCAGAASNSVTYDLGSPAWQVNYIPSLPVQGWSTARREFSMKNTGSLSYFDNYFFFSDSLNATAKSFIHILRAEVLHNDSLLYTFGSADTAIAFSIANLSQRIHTNDTLRVIEYFQIDACPVSGGNSKINYAWGCSSSDICGDDSINPLSFTGVTENPNVLITRLMPGDTTVQYWDNSCTGDITHWRFKIENKDGISYRQVHLKMDQPSGTFPFYTYILNNVLHPFTLHPAAVHDSILYLTSQFAGARPHCLDSNTTAIYYADLFIDTLHSGAIDTLDFYSLRCCPNDEDIDSTTAHEYDIFNTVLHFNDWRLYLKGLTACSDTNQIQLSKSAGASLVGNSIISTNQRSLPDLYLTQDFYSSVSDMYVPHGSPYGPSSEFIVRNAGFDTYSTTLPFFDQQLFQDTITGKPSAALRVIIQMQPGLNFDTAFVPYIYCPLNGGDTLFPSGLAFDSITSQDTVGTAWRGIFTLDSIHFGSYSEFVDFLNFSYFHYRLYPSCTPEPYEPAYYAAKFYFVPLPYAGCDSCFIPLAKTGGKIRIHCPGCKTFGTESTSYSLIRASGSLGWYDSDNDGLADYPLSRLSDTSSIMLPSVRRNASIAGDTLVALQHGIFHNGDQNTYHDLTYEYYQRSHSPLKYIYFEQMIAHSDTNKFNLIPVSAILTVHPDSCTCPFSYTINVANIVRDTSIYFVKVPFDSLIAASGGTYHLRPQDEFDLQIKFVVCKNYVVGTSQAASSNYFDSDPIVAMYVTDTSLSHPSYITHVAGITTGDEGYLQLCNPQLTDTCGYWADTLNPDWFYFCGAFGCIHRFYSIRTRNASSWNNQVNNLPCDKFMTMNQEIKIGGNSYNVFPFEFRPPILTSSIPNPQFVGDVPVGFQSNLADIAVHFHTFFPGCSPAQDQNVFVPDSVTYHPAGVDSFAYLNFAYANENIPFALSSNCPPTTYQRLSGTPLYVGDEYFYYDYTLRLYPDCNSQNCKVPVDAQNTLANIHNYGCSATGATLVPNQSSTTNDTLRMPYFIGGTDCVMQDTLPFLAISSFGTTPVSSHHVDFGFSITNRTFGTNCTVAPNVWLYVPTSAFLSNMTITCTSPASECPLVNNDTAVNGFFHLGNIKCGDPTQRVCNYILSADFDSCLGAGQHTLPVHYGWYCGQYPNTQPHYPANLAGDICSDYPSQLITVNEDSVHLASHIDSTFIQPDTFSLCTPYRFQACIESNNGGINGFLAEINLNDSFLLLDTSSVSLHYNNNTDSVHVSVDTSSLPLYVFDLSPYDSLLNDSTHDLSGGDWICIRYTVTPICGYSNSQMPTVLFGGISFCGETIPDTLGITPVDWLLHGDSCSPHCADSLMVSIDPQQPICSGSQISLKANASYGFLPYTYAWNTGDSTGIIYPVVIADSTIFIVTATDALGHTAIDSIIIRVLPYANCCIPTGFNFADTINYIDLSHKYASNLSYNVIYGATIVMINDTFTVDTPSFKFIATNVVLGPHAVIDVRHGDTLFIESSQLSSCDSLWNSIQLHDSSNAVIISKDSYIMDGDTAVKAHHGGLVSVTASTFNGNYVGISMRTDKSQLHIEGSGFLCSDTLKGHIAGFTDTHVLLSNAGLITIGNGLYATNKFVNATKAIDATRTNLYVYNARIFLDNSLRPTDSATFGIKHIGALGFGSTSAYLLTVGDTTPQQVIIENYGYGTFSKYNTVNHIKNNLFNNNIYGIYQDNIRDGQSFDLYNTMNGNKKAAIYWYDVLIKQGYSNINFNNINWGVTDTSYEGVRVENIGNFTTQVTVVYNKINNSRYGVHLRTMHGLDASSNTIELSQPVNTTHEFIGILVENGSDNSVTGNYIYAALRPQQYFEKALKGISLNKSTGNILRENTLQKMGAGLKVNDNDKPTFLYCNIFDTCRFSIHYNNGNLGDQGNTIQPWDNLFQANIDTLKVNGNGTPSNWFFRGDMNDTTNVYSIWRSNFLLVNPFDSIDADEYECGAVHGGGGGGDKSKSLAKIITDNQPDSSDFAIETKYMDKGTAYMSLNEDSSLMFQGDTTDQVLQGFYVDTKETNIGKLEEVRTLSEVGEVDSALIQNDQINDTNLIEYNTKEVNEIYFAATQNDTLFLSQQQITILESIAYQNPMEGGEAVYRARAMLRIDIPDSYTSFRMGREDFNPPVASFQNYKIYPNPAGDYFVIKNSVDLKKRNIEILVLDNAGRILITKNISIQTTATISARKLSPGSYQIQIKDGEQIESHELIIVK